MFTSNKMKLLSRLIFFIFCKFRKPQKLHTSKESVKLLSITSKEYKRLVKLWTKINPEKCTRRSVQCLWTLYFSKILTVSKYISWADSHNDYCQERIIPYVTIKLILIFALMHNRHNELQETKMKLLVIIWNFK